MAPNSEEIYDDLDDILDEFDEETLSKPAPVASAAQSASVPAAKPADSTVPPQNAGKTAPASATDAAHSASANTRAPAAASSAAVPGAAAGEPSLPELDEQFAKKLNLGMDDLLKDIEGDPEAQKTLEALMASFAPAMAAGNAGAAPKGPASAAPGGSFQDTIAETMNRLNDSKQDIDSASSDDFLERMLGELQNAAGSGLGGGGDMDGLLAGLMEELSSKDILYEPIKELHDKYPEWLEKHSAELAPEELQRYKDQQRAVDDIIAKFEDPSYSDEDKACRKYIAAKMEVMQSSGAPPSELIGNLADGAIPGGLPTNPGDCVIQ